jgi:hypothetical protein
MSYQYDIFISYRRNSETLAWIKEHFLRLLKLCIGLELDREPSVFLDDQNLTESGTSWPTVLGEALGKSRVLIVLWTGNYRASVWCSEELSHMLARQREAKLTTTDHRYGVVIPAIIHGLDKFQKALGEIEYFDIQSCFNVRMAHDGGLAEKLCESLKAQAAAIAKCIDHAPAWRESWPEEAAAEFYRLFYQQAEAVQTSVPRFTLQ